MATIYEIDAAIRACCERVDDETGEVLDQESLDALQMEREAKLEGVALYVKQLLYEAADIKAEEKALSQRRQAKERRIDGLKAYLTEHLEGKKFETAKVKLSFRASTSVSITDSAALVRYLEQAHDECIRYAAPEVNKTELKKLLEQGEAVPGAALEARQNLQIK